MDRCGESLDLSNNWESGMEKKTAEMAIRTLCERVRRFRNQRNWTLAQLASHSGVSRSMLSQIERGEVNPTFQIAYRISQAFGISLGQLVDDSEPEAQIEVVKVSERPFDFDAELTSGIRCLHPVYLEKNVELYEIVMEPGARIESTAHLMGTREFLTVLNGQIEVNSGDQSAQLSKGDSARYPADVAHSLRNIGHDKAEAFLVAVYQADRAV